MKNLTPGILVIAIALTCCSSQAPDPKSEPDRSKSLKESAKGADPAKNLQKANEAIRSIKISDYANSKDKEPVGSQSTLKLKPKEKAKKDSQSQEQPNPQPPRQTKESGP